LTPDHLSSKVEDDKEMMMDEEEAKCGEQAERSQLLQP